MTGVGSAVADTTYAAVGMFALGLVQDFIRNNQSIIMIIGGIVVALVGLVMALKADRQKLAETCDTGGTGISYSVQAMLCAFSNPTALFFMMALLTMFGINSSTVHVPVWLALIAVAAGEMLYWTAITSALNRFLHFQEKTLKRLSLLAGIVIMVLGLVVSVKGIIGL